MLKPIVQNTISRLSIVAVAAAILSVVVNVSNAQLLGYEGFNYTAGTSISALSGGDSSGWAAAWVSTSAGNKIATNTATGLTYGSLSTDGGALQVGTPRSASGFVGSAMTTSATPQRQLPDTFGNLAAANGGVLWISFLFYNPTYTTTSFYRQSNLGLFAAGTEKADLGLDNGSATVGSNFSAWGGTVTAAAPNQSSVSAFSATPQFVLMKLVVDQTAAVDSYYAWFNKDPSTFGDNGNAPIISSADVSNVGADLSSVNIVRFQAGNNNGSGTNAFYTVDEFRIGDSFADVTPVPEPGTLALAGLGGLAMLTLMRRRK